LYTAEILEMTRRSWSPPEFDRFSVEIIEALLQAQLTNNQRPGFKKGRRML
jgi:hypothetical protein